MVKSTEYCDDGSESLGSIAPFLRKCYEMVDDISTDSIISWCENKYSFVISDLTEFTVRLLPKYFKHSNFSSFMRQLNIYGFRKVDTDHWIFANDGFVQGQKHLLKNIRRRKHSMVSDQRKASQQKEKPDVPCEKIENGLWKEVENLKTDKNVLMQELVKLRQHQETAENKLIRLKDKVQGMEKNQQQMLSFLVMAMQSPEFFVQLLQPKENNWRMAEAGNMLEPVSSDGLIVKYQPLMDETPEINSKSDIGKPQESDSLANGISDFVTNSDFMKVLMEEKVSPYENHTPFVLPDLMDDLAWEQLLLASPLSGNVEDATLDGEGTDSEIDAKLTVSRTLEMEIAEGSGMISTELKTQLENSQNLELVTEQMGHLSSEPKMYKEC